MPRHAPPLRLTDLESKQLNARVHDRRSTQQEVLRARIVLLAAQQWESRDIAAELETTHPHGRSLAATVLLQCDGWRGWKKRRNPGKPVSLATATVTKVLRR